jgi:hypothetical protein
VPKQKQIKEPRYWLEITESEQASLRNAIAEGIFDLQGELNRRKKKPIGAVSVITRRIDAAIERETALLHKIDHATELPPPPSRKRKARA